MPTLTLRRCSRCLIPETHETIQFDAEGVCNVCRQHEVKRAVDWDAKKRDLDALIAQHRGQRAAAEVGQLPKCEIREA